MKKITGKQGMRGKGHKVSNTITETIAVLIYRTAEQLDGERHLHIITYRTGTLVKEWAKTLMREGRKMDKMDKRRGQKKVEGNGGFFPLASKKMPKNWMPISRKEAEKVRREV